MKNNNLCRRLCPLAAAAVLLTSLCACQTAPPPQGGGGSAAPAGSASLSAGTEGAGQPPYEVGADSPLAQLPVYSYDSFQELWDVENNGEMLLFQAENDNGYLQYQDDLKAAGFTPYAENEIAGNRYAAWTAGDTNVTAAYCPALQSVRILAETGNGLPPRAQDNEYTDAGIEDALVEVGTDHDGMTQIGMCYLFRLCDGSFLVVDGGHGREGCVKALYDTLVRLSPDPEHIVIAAWFLTHGHADHVGNYYSFIEAHGNSVTIERVVYNYPTQRSFTNGEASPTHITKTAEHAQACGAQRIEAHPGQKYYLRDAEVEILYTCDLFSKLDFYDLNSSSMVFTVTLGGERVMILGDTAQQSSPILVKLYGDSLKSDFMQVAHHGLTGATRALNEAVGADVVLWPSSDNSYVQNRDGYANAPMLEASHVYVAGRRATLIPLPFDPSRVETWEVYDD